ncbi:hypothetical protein Acr_01g0006190 [Actinidia rufa]|uniref:Uncharacterized protein n=1 Tax=Actinidia rufa TaxID=165716 RepID=A0A7J0E322_9ERIC|nr:hypothetical protein Acr_01g0006190 [Actinidia rufa]
MPAHLHANVRQHRLDRAHVECIDAERSWRIGNSELEMMVFGPSLGIMGFSGRFWKRSEQCAATPIEKVNNCGRPRNVPTLLNYMPIYWHIIPHRANQLGQVQFRPLRIREGVVRRQRTSLEELSEELTANDLDFPLVQPAFGDLVEDSFVSGGGANTSSKEVDMAPKPRVLAQKKPKVVDPLTDVQVPLPVQDLVLALLDPTEAKPSLPSSSFLRKCKGKSTRGRHAPIGYGGPCCRGFDEVWRSDCDAARSGKDLSSKYSTEVKKASKRASTLESNLKKAKEKLNVEEAASKVSDNAATKFKLEELSTPVEHPTWTAAAPKVVLPNAIEVYSPLILPGFIEKKSI